MKNISSKDIKHLADLSGLEFDDAETSKMENNLKQIFEFVDELSNCSEINNLSIDEHELSISDLRDDEPCMKKQPKISSNTDKNKYFSVPKVVD